MAPRRSMKANAGRGSKGPAPASTKAASRTRTNRSPRTRMSLRPPPPALAESVTTQQQQQQTQKRLQENITKQKTEFEIGVLGGNKEEHENLADAVMVADCSYMTEQDDSFFPIGVEFDPDAKEKAYKRTIRVCYMVLGALLLAAIVVGLSVGLVAKKEKDAAKGYRETLGIQQVLENRTGLSLTKTNSVDSSSREPYLQALDWIINTDPTGPLPGDSNLLQRFIAAYIYFATSVDHEWAWCSPPTQYSGDSCTFFNEVRLDNDQSFAKEFVGSRWLSGTDECSWVGLYCDEEKQIESINLNGMNMSGLFPEGIQFLTSLSQLKMSWGNLRGPLPTVVAQMKRLVLLELHSNKFTGPIASEWYQYWTHLQDLDLSNNKLSGSIAPEIGNWKELHTLQVQSNSLSGSIPSEIGSRNLLTGPIPQEISMPASLQNLYLSDNLLSGTMDALYEAEKLEDVYLDGNRLTGTISPRIAKLRNLFTLILRDNELSGQLPTELGLLPLNGGVSFAGNNFTGSVPQELCNMLFLAENGVYHNWNLEADCQGPLDCPEGCCTTCCMSGGINCLSMP